MTLRVAGAALLCLALVSGAVSSGVPVLQGPAGGGTETELRLANGLRARLISTPDASVAAAAVAVDAGLDDDPPGGVGMAHLTEHVLLGNGGDDNLLSFVRDRRGEVNALTNDLQTEYYFSVAQQHFMGALRRLARLLEDPSFTKSSVERELAAVDAEFKASSGEGPRRELAVLRASINRDHPWSHAFGGNSDSLGPADTKLTQGLRDFFRDHYSSDRMVLTVVSPAPLEALESTVKKLFGSLPARPRPARHHPPLIGPHQLPRLMQIPSGGLRVLSFWFPVRISGDCRARASQDYVLSLFDSHGVGTLTAQLEAQGWIDDEAVARVEATRDISFTRIGYVLTADGADHVAAIGEALFAYLDLLRDGGADGPRLAQLRAAASLHRAFPDPVPPLQRARDSSSAMLAGGDSSACSELDPSDVLQALAPYSPDNLLLTVIGPNQPADASVAAYHLRYSDQRLPAAWVAQWQSPAPHPELGLPELSPFDPGRPTAVAAAEPAAPRLMLDSRRMKLWHAPRSSPKDWVQVEWSAPDVVQDARDAVYLAILTQALSAGVAAQVERGRPFAYRAGLEPTPTGLELRLSGYSGAFDEFASAVLGGLAEESLDEASFDRAADRVQRRETSFLSSAQPLQVLEDELRQVVLAPAAGHQAMAEASRQVSYHDFRRWLDAFRRSATARSLVVGELSRGDAAALAVEMSRFLGSEAGEEHTPGREDDKTPLPAPSVRELLVDHPDVALVRYLRAPDRSLRSHANMLLLGPLLNDFFQHALRDQRQLGYLIAVKPAVYADFPGAIVAVQSPRISARALLDVTREELLRFREYLAALPAARFAQFRDASVEQLAELPTSLDEAGSRAWDDISSSAYGPNSSDRIPDVVASLSKEDVLEFYRDMLTSLEQHSLTLVSPGWHRDGPNTDITGAMPGGSAGHPGD